MKKVKVQKAKKPGKGPKVKKQGGIAKNKKFKLGKKGKSRDENAPKKPLTGYFRYVTEVRESVKEKNPDFGMGDIAKQISAQWEELGEEGKKKYNDAYQAEKAQYDIDFAKYLEENPKAGGKPKRERDENAPKKPLCGYFRFMMEVRDDIKDQNPDFKTGDIGKKAGEMWKELGEEGQKKYDEAYQAEKEQYAIDVAKYLEENPNAKIKGVKRARDENMPKRPMSGYFRYMAEVRDDIKEKNPDLKFGEIGKKAGEMWKELGEEGQKKYDEAYQAEKAQYDIDFATYREANPEVKKAKKSKPAAAAKPKRPRAPQDSETYKPLPNPGRFTEEAPKRPLQAYFLYFNEVKDDLMKEDPAMEIRDCNKKAMQLYFKMAPDAKQKYEEPAAKNKALYEQDLAEYNARKEAHDAKVAAYEKSLKVKKSVSKGFAAKAKAAKAKAPPKETVEVWFHEKFCELVGVEVEDLTEAIACRKFKRVLLDRGLQGATTNNSDGLQGKKVDPEGKDAESTSFWYTLDAELKGIFPAMNEQLKKNEQKGLRATNDELLKFFKKDNLFKKWLVKQA